MDLHDFHTLSLAYEFNVPDTIDWINFLNMTNTTDGNPGIFLCNNTGLGSGGMQLFRAVFLSVFLLVFLLGLAGNVLLVAVLLRRRRGLRVTEVYLLHLGLADLLLLLTFPFILVEPAGGWVFGDFLCRVVGVVHRLNFLCGCLLLACIGFDRYLAIVHAVRSLQGLRPRAVHLCCSAVWLLCLGLSVPDFAFFSVEESPTSSGVYSCNLYAHGSHGSNWKLVNRCLTHVLGFFLPLAIMSYCYSAVVITLSHSQRSLDKQGAIRLALLITAVFCLCWLPYNLVLLLDTLHDMNALSLDTCKSRDQMRQALMVTESLGYTHCCLNPLLYAFLGVRFRQDLCRLLASWGCPARACLSPQRDLARKVSISEAGPTTSSTLI